MVVYRRHPRNLVPLASYSHFVRWTIQQCDSKKYSKLPSRKLVDLLTIHRIAFLCFCSQDGFDTRCHHSWVPKLSRERWMLFSLRAASRTTLGILAVRYLLRLRAWWVPTILMSPNLEQQINLWLYVALATPPTGGLMNPYKWTNPLFSSVDIELVIIKYKKYITEWF
jgi:hypothetical protein